MTSFLYAIILSASPFVLFFLGDGLVRLAEAFGDALQARAAALRAEPEVSGIASIAIVGDVS